MSLTSEELYLAEWKEIRESLRYFGNKRFAQLTIFMLATGSLFKLFFEQSDAETRYLISYSGAILSVCFFIMEYRAVKYWNKFVLRAKIIEDEIKIIKLTQCRPEIQLCSGTNATNLIYILSFLFWEFNSFCL